MTTFATGRNVLAAAGVKGSQLPQPLEVPSPHDRSRPKHEPFTRHDYRRALTLKR